MSSSSLENLSPQVIRSVIKELKSIIDESLEGIKVIFNDEDVTDIQALIDGPQGTPYENGQFKVRCVLGKQYPSQPPSCYFITKLFHPNVSRTGEICVNTLKKDWKPDLGIKHILLTIKCLLIVPNPESALNEDAGKLLLDHYEDYCKRARMMTEIHAITVKETNASKTSTEKCQTTSTSSNNTSTITVSKKQGKTTKILKDKKRTLKRL